MKVFAAGNLGTYRESIDKEPDQRLDFSTRAIGDGRADNDVHLARIPVEQGLETRQERHKERHALAAAQLPELISERRCQLEVMTLAARMMKRRARSIGW